jgi:hypothetical protein
MSIEYVGLQKIDLPYGRHWIKGFFLV